MSNAQAQIFGEDAALYDRFRPGYPRALMETVIADTSDLPVLEIGPGTGKATRALIALGKQVHAVEPDTRMSAVLRVTCGDAVLRVLDSPLEAANLPASAYDLAVAAQSWHWVDPATAYDLVAESLVPQGRLALLWHHPLPDQGLFGEAIRQLYHRLAPAMPSVFPGTKASGFDPATEPPAATGRFHSWTRHEHRWTRQLDAPTLVGWLCSSSDHRLLPLDQRSELMAGVAALVDEFGGEAAVEMRTVAHLAHRI